MTIDVKFNDSGHASQSKADPKWPNGRELSAAEPGQESCTWNLPYPAPGVGTYSVVCRKCHYSALVSVAGRADDPVMITLPCKARVH